MRCPVLVGRRAETTALRTALGAAHIGRGSAVALTGPPGIGKSRLLREAAAAAAVWGVPVLRGRAVPSGAASAFRPLTEALLGALRHTPVPDDDPALAPFAPALARILPLWRTSGPRPDDSVVVLGEAVLRLLTALDGNGVLLALEDLQWADPDTLAVVEYLADNVATERVLVVATARDEPGPARELLRGLATRDACTVLVVPPLADAEVDAMAAACLGGDVPTATKAALRRRAGGTPLLVEELLVAGVDPAAAVPATVSELVAGRLAALPEGARRCVEVAAVLGGRFDWRLLRGVLGHPAPDVLAALRFATATDLLEPDGDDEFRFHHALGRDAVLAAMLPPERAEWARRALDEVAAAHPALDGPWCDLAADLALRAGDTRRTAELLHEAGRRNLDGGALASAEAVLRRAVGLTPGGDQAAAIDETLADVLALSGRTGEAVAAARRALVRARPGAATARAHLRLARVHATAGAWADARADLDTARAVLGDPPADEGLALRVDSVATQVALGDGRFADAATSARGVLARAESSGADDAVCEALLVLGRLARRRDLAAAEDLFTRARRVAEAAGLTLAAARAAAELCIADVHTSLRMDRLHDARDRAATVGDLATVAVLDLQAAAAYSMRWELDEAVAAARRCATASRRLRLPTLPKALVLAAAADALRGGPADLERALAEAVGLTPDDTHLRGEAAGTRAFRALTAADDTRALRHLDDAIAAFRHRPNEVTGSPVTGVWILLHTVADLDRTTPPSPPEPFGDRWTDGLSRFAEAVTAGRRGDAAGAARAFADADARMREPVDIGWFRLQARRLVAGAGIADGWGDPATWLREDLVVLDARGEERWAAALRGLLRRAGETVPRRGRDAGLPAALRERAVTVREADVLTLVVEGRANREIAERLFLSPRTVEKHVERLLAKTGVGRRAELVAWAARELGPGTERDGSVVRATDP